MPTTSRFAYLAERDRSVVLVRTDGELETLPQFSTLEEALDVLPGTDEGRLLGIYAPSLTRILTLEGVCAVNASRVVPFALADPPNGWRAAFKFEDSDLEPLVLATRPVPARLEAEDVAYEALSNAIVAAARDGLPGRGLFKILKKFRPTR